MRLRSVRFPQPLGSDEVVTIDAVRGQRRPDVFHSGIQWRRRSRRRPAASSFNISGLSMRHSPAFSDRPATPAVDSAGLCSDGVSIDPQLLQRIGALNMDVDGSYRIDEANRTLDIGMNVDLRDIQSVACRRPQRCRCAKPFQVLPEFQPGGFDFAVRVSPEFAVRRSRPVPSARVQRAGVERGAPPNRRCSGLRTRADAGEGPEQGGARFLP